MNEPRDALDSNASEEAADAARARRLYLLACGWGVLTLALLWLFARTFRG